MTPLPRNHAAQAKAQAICRKPGFLDMPRVHARTCLLAPYLHAGCSREVCVGGVSLGNGVGAGGRCLLPRVGGIRWSGPARGPAPMSGRCVGGRVGGWSVQCLPAVRGWVRVDALAGAASSGSFRAVALVVGLLLREGRVGCRNVPNNAYAQDDQELGTSAGACRAGSLAGAWFRQLPTPPRTLVCTSA